VAAGIMLIATHPPRMLVAISYGYLASAFVELAITRFKHRGERGIDAAAVPAASIDRDSAAR
jgi:hypothetical protein